MPEYKTDKASIDAALAHVVEEVENVKSSDAEAIGGVIWHASVRFDVAQDALESAYSRTLQ